MLRKQKRKWHYYEKSSVTQKAADTKQRQKTSSVKFIFGDAISAGVIVVVGALITFFYWLFVKTILRVGEARFYLENRRYPESRLPRIFFIYQIRRTRHVAWVMLCRFLFTALWFLTIAGGVVALYSWRMVPLLLAENPELSRREAFAASSRLMRGHKWHAFLLDLSFLGWDILNAVTFGLVGIFWLTPFRTATESELYITLRAHALQAWPGAAAVFTDPWLTRRPRGRP